MLGRLVSLVGACMTRATNAAMLAQTQEVHLLHPKSAECRRVLKRQIPVTCSGKRSATAKWIPLCAYPLFLCALAARGVDFCVQGSANMYLYMASGTTQAQSTVWFTAQLRACRWFIRCQRDEELGTGDYAEASCDGTNVYYLSCISNAVAVTRAAGERTAPNIANAVAYKGEVIHHRTADELSPIWLACASGCFFQSRTTDSVEPGMVFDGFGKQYGPPEHGRLRAEWTFTDRTCAFPAQVVYFGDGTLQARRGAGKLAKLPMPYDAGCTSAIYTVDVLTNVGGVTVPVRSSLKIYTAKPKPVSAQDLRLFVEYVINLTNWEQATSMVVFQPHIPGPTVINDRRDRPLYFWATNGWPSIETLRGYTSYKPPATDVAPSKQYTRRWLVRVLFASTLFIPGVYASQRYFRRIQNTPKTESNR